MHNFLQKSRSRVKLVQCTIPRSSHGLDRRPPVPGLLNAMETSKQIIVTENPA